MHRASTEAAINETLAETGFEPTASVPERITSLVVAGFSLETLAEVTGVKVESVERWKQGPDDLRIRAYEELDDLRRAMQKLIAAGLDPDLAAIWMQTPLTDTATKAPIDAVAHKPEVVFNAIDLVFGEYSAEQRRVVKPAEAKPSAKTAKPKPKKPKPKAVRPEPKLEPVTVTAPENTASFGEIFAAQRRVRNIKGSELQQAGIKPHTLKAIEEGRHFPSEEQLTIIIDLLAEVAEQQGADSEAERQLLLTAWWETDPL